MRIVDRSIALKKLQQEELEILIEFSKFCERHGLTWFLDSGTALGAARHKGFIPWDDDIDVGMPRSDYDKFLQFTEFSGGICSGYSVHTFSNTTNYAAMFAKIYKEGTVFATKETIEAGCRQGIFIDVFPYDEMPDDQAYAEKIASQAHKWQVISYLYHTSELNPVHAGILGKVEKLMFWIMHRGLSLFFTRKKILANYGKIVAQSGDSNRWIAYAYPVLPGFDGEVLFPPKDCEFCCHTFPGPRKMEEYLSASYGDWRTLPDPADRKTHLPVKLVFSDGSEYVK